MRTRKDEVTALFEALTELLHNSSNSEFEALCRGNAILAIVNRPGSHAEPTSKKTASNVLAAEVGDMASFLLTVDSREEGLKQLEVKQFPRKNLETLARHFQIPIRKEDNAEKLRERIVDAAVGSRLNAQAIRGN